jgi:hypothetical protein
MSGNSGSQGASGMNAPSLPGWKTTWDHEQREWVLRRAGFPDLRGRNQRELELARGRLVVAQGDELMDICRDTASRGYSPPPRT